MGIQGFFAWLKELTPSAFTKLTPTSKGRQFDHVLIECNNFLHRASALHYKPERVLKVLTGRLWYDLKNATIPKKTLFFAVDGPGPLAKIPEQRKRRFEAHTRLMKKDSTSFHTAHLTPGCIFMNQVDDFLILFACRAFAAEEWTKPLKVTVSGSRLPGEGELKLIKQAKQLMQKHKNDSYAFVTNDADIVALAMANSLKVSLYNSFSKEFFNVSVLSEYLSKLFPTAIPTRVARDFALLTIFSGGDMMPRMKHVSMNSMWTTYKSFRLTHPDMYITVDGERGGIFIKSLVKFCQIGLDNHMLMAQEYQKSLTGSHHIKSEKSIKTKEWLRCMSWVLDGGLRGEHLDYSVLYEGAAPSPAHIVELCPSEEDQVIYAPDSISPPLCPEMCASALLPLVLRPFIPYHFGPVLKELDQKFQHAANDPAASIEVLKSLQSYTLPKILKPSHQICISAPNKEFLTEKRLTEAPTIKGFTPISHARVGRYQAVYLDEGMVDYSKWYKMVQTLKTPLPKKKLKVKKRVNIEGKDEKLTPIKRVRIEDKDERLKIKNRVEIRKMG